MVSSLLLLLFTVFENLLTNYLVVVVMANWAQLKAFTTELSSAIESLTGYQQIVEACPELSIQAKSTAQPIVPPGAPIEAQRARNTVLANICAIHKLLAEPVDFLQELVRQVSYRLFRGV